LLEFIYQIIIHKLPLFSFKLSKHFFHSFFENGYFIDDDVPDGVQIKAEIVVDKDVAKAGYFIPVDILSAAFRLIRKALSGFSKHLQIPYYRILHKG
jgi:hypothetical protein